MTAAAAAANTNTHPTPSLASVFDTLVGDIVSGRYPSGSRLPPERDLARALGASRPTLREALRRLGEWGLIEARRGSGVIVRDIRYWALDVLPAYLRLGAPTQGPHALGDMISMLLQLRRTMFIDILKTVGSRVHPEGLAEARAAAERAWSVRHDLGEFVRADYDVVCSVLLAARFLPALWMMNALAGVYIDLARTITGAAHLPDDYLE